MVNTPKIKLTRSAEDGGHHFVLNDDEHNKFLLALERSALENEKLRKLLDDNGVRWRNEHTQNQA